MAQNFFFYDGNIRKWLYQIIRLFSEYTVTYGLNPDGSQAYSTVPVIYGDSTFSAATIARLNSENTMPNFPMISIYINNLKFDRQRTQTPTFQDTLSIRTRQYDSNANVYLPTQANAYTIKRLMPVPYLLDVKVDIVTSNTQQKTEILEQILPLYNPALELQKTDNYLDWESLSYIELRDVNWSNRTIPVNQGSDSSYDVCTLQFDVPIWMSLPAQVSKMGVIFKVIMDVAATTDLNDLVIGTRQVVTYNNYGLYVLNSQIRALQQGPTTEGHLVTDGPAAFWDAVDTTSNANIGGQPATSPVLYGEPIDWSGLLSAYGKIRPGVSMVGLTYDNSKNEILGTITISPTDSTILLFNANVLTLPSNTLPAINTVVNPMQVAPGIGLSNATVGDSYLLTSNIGSAWPYDNSNSSANASVNDIITYTGTNWDVTFDASLNNSNIQFVFDTATNLQLKWNGSNWVQGWMGPYDSSSWRLII